MGDSNENGILKLVFDWSDEFRFYESDQMNCGPLLGFFFVSLVIYTANSNQLNDYDYFSRNLLCKRITMMIMENLHDITILNMDHSGR